MLKDYCPADPLMAQAWGDCLQWAIHDPQVLDLFLAETGVQVPTVRTALDQMIDQASGVDAAIAEQFMAWFNSEIWGEG